MAKVEFTRVETDEEVEDISIKDGQLIYSKSGKTYMDYGDERIPTGSGGGSVNVDTEMSDISENAVQNKVIKEYVDNEINDTKDLIPNLSNQYGTSDENGYTQEYINTNVGVVESGSNTNGSYIKYADGTMICYNNLFFNMNITSQFEGIYYANTGEISFAQPFITTPVINITLRGVAGGGYSFYTPSATGFTGFVWKIQNKSNVDLYVMYFAIGRWK